MRNGQAQPRRERFLREPSDSVQGQCESAILQLLLAQDGSTTQLFESIAGAPITVRLLEQHPVGELPRELDGFLPGDRFLRRLTSLEIHGQVLLDSLAYIAIDVLPPPIVRELEEGVLPIGQVLSSVWTRRAFAHDVTTLLVELWKAVGEPDPQASRTSCIYTPRAPCILIGETFRRGAWDAITSNVSPIRTPSVGH